MGQSSSQIEEAVPLRPSAPVSQTNAMAPPPRPKTRKPPLPSSVAGASTTASVQLAQDLERDIADVAQRADRPKKRKKPTFEHEPAAQGPSKRRILKEEQYARHYTRVAIPELERVSKRVETQEDRDQATLALTVAKFHNKVAHEAAKLARAAFNQRAYKRGAYEKTARETIRQEYVDAGLTIPAIIQQQNGWSDANPRRAEQHKRRSSQVDASTLPVQPALEPQVVVKRHKRRKTAAAGVGVAQHEGISETLENGTQPEYNADNSDPKERIASWLDSQQSPDKLDEDAGQGDNEGEKAAETPAGEPVELPPNFIREPKHDDDEKEESSSPSSPDIEDSRATSRPAAVAAEKRKKKKTTEHHRKSSKQESKKRRDEVTKPRWLESTPTVSAGPFTREEINISDRIFREVQQEHNFSEGQLKMAIQDWRQANVFKAELQAALPNRSKDAIRKFAKRRYHNMERGYWTKDQDEALWTAYATLPDKWTQISDRVDRTAADCKDRWTRYLKLQKRNSGPWSIDEECDLYLAIMGCLADIREAHRTDQELQTDVERQVSLLNWDIIVDRIGGRRNNRQCREKWQKLWDSEAAEPYRSRKTVTEASKEIDSIETDIQSTRLKEAHKALENFEIGDFYDVFVEVHTSLPDHNAQFSSESTFWSIVGRRNISRFSITWNGTAIRRIALQVALQDWPRNDKKISRKLQKATTLPAKALALARWIEKSTSDTDSLQRTYKPELMGKSKDEILELRRNAKKVRKPPTAKTKKEILSRDHISDSENEALDEADADEKIARATHVRQAHVQEDLPNLASVREEEQSPFRSTPSQQKNDDDTGTEPESEDKDEHDEADEPATEAPRTTHQTQGSDHNEVEERSSEEEESDEGSPDAEKWERNGSQAPDGELQPEEAKSVHHLQRQTNNVVGRAPSIPEANGNSTSTPVIGTHYNAPALDHFVEKRNADDEKNKPTKKPQPVSGLLSPEGDSSHSTSTSSDNTEDTSSTSEDSDTKPASVDGKGHNFDEDDEQSSDESSSDEDTSEDTSEDEEDDGRSRAIPETQYEAPDARVADNVTDEIPASSINSRYARSLAGTPGLSPDDFLQRCRAAGRKQHAHFTASNRPAVRRTNGIQSRRAG